MQGLEPTVRFCATRPAPRKSPGWPSLAARSPQYGEPCTAHQHPSCNCRYSYQINDHPVELRTRTCGSLSLGYSRRGHAWAFERLDAEHLYESVVRAFAYFGGVTAELLVDNPKALVLQHHQGEDAVFNERFLDLCAHYGVSPLACRLYRARTKGKDERLVHYLKHHFFVRYRAFESWAHLNQLLETWLREEADQRVHGTVREVVADCGSHAAVARRPRGAQAASGCNSMVEETGCSNGFRRPDVPQ